MHTYLVLQVFCAILTASVTGMVVASVNWPNSIFPSAARHGEQRIGDMALEQDVADQIDHPAIASEKEPHGVELPDVPDTSAPRFLKFNA